MDLFNLNARIGIDTSEYENGLRNAGEQSSNFATKVKTGLSNVKGLFDKFGSFGSTVVSAFQKIGTGVASAFDKIKSIVTNSFTAITGAATGGVAALQGIAASTEEFRVAMGKLNTAYEAAGYSAETANEAYSEFYKILGDTDTATEASQLLAKLAQSEEDVTQWTNIAAGVSGTFGDSLPIEGLIEASNETAKVGAVTGALADALNWAGISEDAFNETLSGLSTEADRNQYIMNTLANTYSDAAASFYKNNEELIKARENQEQLDRVLAKLGETVQSVKNRLSNDFIPSISGVASAFTDLLNGVSGADVALSTAISGMIQTVTEKIPEFLNFGMQILGAIINGIVTNLPQIATAISQVVQTIATTISNNLPEFLAMGFSVLSQILQGIINDLPQLIQTVSQITQTFSSSITAHLPEFIQYGLQILQQLINGIVQNLPTIIQTAAQIVQQLINGLVQVLPQLVQAARKIIVSIVEGISNNLPTLIPAIVAVVTTLATALANPDFLVPLINAALQLIVAIVQGITQSLPEIIKAAPEIIGALVVGLVQSLPNLGIAAMKIVYALGTGIRDALGTLVDVAADIIGTILQGIGQGIEKIIELGGQIVSGLWKGIKEKAEWIYNKIKDFFEGIVDGIKGILGIHSPSRVFADIGEQMVNGLSQGWNDAYGDFEKTIENSNARLSQLMSQRNLLTEQYNQKSAGLSDWDYARQMKLLNEKSARKKEIEDEMFQIRRTMENSRPVTVTKKSEPRPEQKSGSFTYTWGDYKKDHTKKSKNVHYTMADFVAALDEKYRKWVGKGVIEDVDPEDTKRAQESQVLGVLASAFNKQMQNTSADVINQFWSSTVDKLAEASESVKSLKIPKVETVSSPEIATVNNARNAFTTAPQMQSAPQAPQEYNFTINLDGKVLARETFREIDRQSNLAGQSLTRIVS